MTLPTVPGRTGVPACGRRPYPLADAKPATLPQTMPLKLLSIEDQADVAANIWDYFQARGHRVDHAADGASGLRKALGEAFDVIILDLGLPRLDGLLLCRALREAGRDVPIIMVTARDELDDKLKGFAEGADDYVVKPFSLRELEARVKALVARRRAGTTAVSTCCGLELDVAAHVARRDGRTIPLTRAQLAVLQCLMRSHPGVVHRETLAYALWGEDGGDTAAIHSHIHDLRILIDRPFNSRLIKTVHGVGYRIECAA
jgi:DNA-binding response OmpR family regulator